MVDISQFAEKIEREALLYKGREVCDDPRGEFMAEMIRGGYEAPRVLSLGKIMRVKAPDDKKKKSGWCWYEEFDDNYNDGAVIGYGLFGSWKEGDAKDTRHQWSSRNDELLTKEQRLEITEAREIARKQRDAEQQIIYQEAALECWDKWQAATAVVQHDYLTRKQVGAYGIKTDGKRLIVPMLNSKGELASLQYIYADGFKHYHTGGKVAGASFKITGAGDVVYVAEGYATAASIHMATGATVYVAFSVHKLLDVVTLAKNENKASAVVIAGDDDRNNETNIGKRKAKEIAQALGVVAKFPDHGGDFNDEQCAYGIEAVKEQLTREYEIFQEKGGKEEDMPDALYNPPGILGDIVNYYRLTDMRSNDILATPTALALGSVVCGRNFDTSNNNRSSLFILSVGRTGAGKEHCSRVIDKVLTACDMGKFNAANGYKSGSAVFSKCLDMPRHIAVLPEFSVFLDAMTNKNASSHQAQAKGVLLEVSTKLDGTLTPAAYATKGLKAAEKKVYNDCVVNPAVTLMATTTPEVYSMINNEMLADGFLNRFIMCISDAPMKYLRPVGKHDVPEGIKEWVAAINKRLGDRTELATEPPEMITLEFTPEALDVFTEFERECTDRINGNLSKSVLKNMLVRSAEMALRISLIVALAKNPDAEYIYKEDVQWGVDFIKYNSDKTLKDLKRNLSNSPHEKKRMEFLQAIRDAKEDGVMHRDITKIKPFSAENKRTREELLGELVDGGLVVEVTVKQGGKGRPNKCYLAVA
jgi:phage/plasmid primase-like uncharacterized protein